MQRLRGLEPRDPGDVDGEGKPHAAEQRDGGVGRGCRERSELVFVGGYRVDRRCAVVGGSRLRIT